LSVRAISRLSARACFCKRPRGRPLLLLLLRLEPSDLRRVLRPQCALLCRQSMRSESMRTVWRRASKQATALSVRAEACARRGCDTSSAIRHRPLDSARAGGRAANAVLASSAALPHPAIACSRVSEPMDASPGLRRPARPEAGAAACSARARARLRGGRRTAAGRQTGYSRTGRRGAGTRPSAPAAAAAGKSADGRAAVGGGVRYGIAGEDHRGARREY
jgi:hypothetical protein